MSYEVIDHTADVGIHAKGKDLDEAFQETALGMFSIIADLDKVDAVGEFEIELEADGWDNLLVDFLSELIFLFEVEDVVFSDFEVRLEEDEKKRLSCRAMGEKIDHEKHDFDTEIKAVSYHELKVNTDGDIEVIFDI
ncbi:MAG: archease [Thermoplasmata archaeon]